MAAVGASLAMAAAAERTSPYTLFVDSFNTVMAKIMEPAGEPISTPTPRAKPERQVAKPATPAPSDAPNVVAQCGYASIVSKMAKDGKTPIYRATFAPGMADDMIGEGCERFFQGCNVCTVRYDGCEPAVKAACTDTACLEKACERNVICSAKSCTIQGKAPTCDSRIARTQCMRVFFQ